MTLKELQAFYWAAKLGSFAIAADRLSISQSSLSKRIAELEAELGQTLFDRSARRASLTHAGEAILEGAKQMIDLESDVRARVKRADGLQGVLRFGVGELGATTWFPRFMQSVMRDYPQFVINPLVSQARVMENEVERGTLDCAVIASHATRQNIASQPLRSVAFAWMASPQLKIPQRRLTLEALEKHALIVPNPLSGQSQPLHDWMAMANVRPNRLIQCNSLNAIVEMAVAGTGISLLPQGYTAPIVARKLLVRLRSDSPAPPLTYTFIWRRDDMRPLIARVKALVIRDADFTLTSSLWKKWT